MGMFTRNVESMRGTRGMGGMKMKRGTSLHEGRLTTRMEHATARLPSNVWLFAAGASILGALALRLSGKTEDANFVGAWAPTLLTIGVYNKVVKLLGSE